jgi:hypothetical protein
MSKYDITGIGINLREVSDGGGNVKLKVLGLVLDSAADIAGVKQVINRSSFFLVVSFAVDLT